MRAESDEYEVELDRPYGIKFYKGEDGGTYVDALAAGQAAYRSGVIQEGDKVIATRYVLLRHGYRCFGMEVSCQLVTHIPEDVPSHRCLSNLWIRPCSAVFGDDMWPASGYGQTMYTVRNRIGIMRFKFKKMFGAFLAG